MDASDIIGLVIVIIVGLSLVGLSVPLLMGRGAWLIAGYNTMSKEEQEHWDGPALARFTGKIIGLLTVTLMPVMCIFKFLWLTVLYTVLVVGLGVFAAVWCNTGKRFRK